MLDHLWLAIPFLALPALLPFVTAGIPRSFDGRTHLLRIAALERAIQDGVWLPRWMSEMQLGHGYPLFNFYGPAAYYVAVALGLVGGSVQAGFVLTMALAIMLGGLGMYFWARDVFGAHRSLSALVAATAYLYAPYLLLNVYVRGSVAEALAQGILPWILWAFRRIWRTEQPQRYFGAGALFLAALAMVHGITLIFMAVALLGYLVVLWRGQVHEGKPTLAALRWTLLALALAMGISAFAWLPMIAERANLTTALYDIARTGWLPGNGWSWSTVLDPHWFYQYNFERPVRLGLIQLLVAISGFLLARRRDGEWFYWGLVAVVAGAMIGRWALPIWSSNDVMALMQFPWRLLSIISIPLALFVGGNLAPVRAVRWQALGSIALMCVIIAGNMPHLDRFPMFSSQAFRLGPESLAQAELEKSILDPVNAASSVREFRPRWAGDAPVLTPATATPENPIQVTPINTNATNIALAASSTSGGSLRFEEYYYPSWRVTVDGKERPTYPSSNLGLLTVDIPGGQHVIEKVWQGTPAERVANWISLVALVALAIMLWRWGRMRLLAGIVAIAAAVVALLLIAPAPMSAITLPENEVNTNDITLVGYRVKDFGDGDVTLYPYWYVTRIPAAELKIRWQVLDEAGKVISDFVQYPYFNAQRAGNWAAGTLIDDAMQLALPAGLPAGTYRIAATLGATLEELAVAPVIIGKFALAHPMQQSESPQHVVAARFDEQIQLVGFDITPETAAAQQLHPLLTTVEAGGALDLTLYWQAAAPAADSYHGFVHLVDDSGTPLTKADQAPGPELSPATTWLPGRTYPDTYRLNLPEDSASGLYWPLVGLYTFDDGELLPVYEGVSTEPVDVLRLPPIKVVNSNQIKTSGHPLNVHFGDNIELLGFDLETAETQLRAGERITVTMVYRSTGAQSPDLKRFVQLVGPGNAIAAQDDGIPQQGANPTWSWVSGEIIRDQVTLQVNDHAIPGVYRLLLGFYAGDGVRAPAATADGSKLPDNAAPLTEMEIIP